MSARRGSIGENRPIGDDVTACGLWARPHVPRHELLVVAHREQDAFLQARCRARACAQRPPLSRRHSIALDSFFFFLGVPINLVFKSCPAAHAAVAQTSHLTPQAGTELAGAEQAQSLRAVKSTQQHAHAQHTPRLAACPCPGAAAF